MNPLELIYNRHVGFVRFACVSNYPNYDFKETLIRLGLFPKPDNLTEINKAQAEVSVAVLMWRDLAYNDESMHLDEANKIAREFVEFYATKDSKFYSNGDWHLYHQEESSQWSPMTDATFDGGVVIVSPSTAICFWVEDED